MTRYARVVTGCVASSLLAAPLSAQRITSSLDLSGTSVWYADSLRSAGSSVSPAIRADWSRATVSAFANLAKLEHGNFSAQAAISPSMFTPSAGALTGEVAASLGGSTHQDGTRTGEMLGLVRAHVIGGGEGAWIGAGGGRTWDGVEWRSVRQGEVGAWIARDDVTTLLSVTPVRVQDTIRYTDVQAALRYPVRSLEFGVTAGARSGAVSAAIGGTSRAWGSVSIVAAVTPMLSVVGNAGTYPVDLTQGFPGGRFVTIALRVMSRAPRVVARETAVVAPKVEPVDPTRGRTTFEMRTAAGRERVLRVFAPSARSVEINADFTRWQPVALARGTDGWWTATRSIAAGTYQMNMRIDGGSWLAPPGLLVTKDEFGGTAGVLTVQ